MDQPILYNQTEFKDLDITINGFMSHVINVRSNTNMIFNRKWNYVNCLDRINSFAK